MGRNKSVFRGFFLLLAFLIMFSKNAEAKSSYLDLSNVDKGIISTDYGFYNDEQGLVKIKISKGSQFYVYSLNSNDAYPLQMENGEYNAKILRLVEDNQYSVVESKDFSVNIDDDEVVFLQSTQNINWNASMKAIVKAKELAHGKTTDEEKVRAIYEYIVDNYSYDYEKARNVESGYLPSIDTFFASKAGMCYDYASLMAGMLRSLGIPMKLVMGYKNDINDYHAWNQVYLSDTGQWVTIDTTYDAGYRSENVMFKDPNEYSVDKVY